MNDEFADKAIRLLDIVHSLYGTDKKYPYENLPFSVDADGGVVLCEPLANELSKEENSDLYDWAQENIVNLF